MADKAEKINTEKHLCMGCMTEKNEEGPCAKCGYLGIGPSDANDLPAGFLLNNRYLTGKLISSNGESTLYIGYDTTEDVKVFLREFMPAKIVTRNHSNMHLKALKGSETTFKRMTAEFEDLCVTLKNMAQVQNLMQVLEVLHENDTIYVVYRFINTMTLGEMIALCGGEIKWSKCKKTFMTLINTLSAVHKKGLIHAGISPQTILIDDKGNPYLTAFSVNEVRCSDSELDGELFEGYSAPEQYVHTHCYGEWTDVYSICAVMYKAITGTMPSNARDRRFNDNLVDVIELDNSVLPHVSDAIRDGMLLSLEDRIHTADALCARLLDNVESNTAIYTADPAMKETGNTAVVLPKTEEVQKKKRPPSGAFLSLFIPMLLTTIVLGGLLWLFMHSQYESTFFNNSAAISSEQAASALSQIDSKESQIPLVPNFIGQYIDTITTDVDYVTLFEFTIKYEYSDTYPVGVVCEQSPEEGTRMANRGTVIVSVSKGSNVVKIPDLTGSTVERAIQDLEKQELSCQIIYVADDKYVQGLVAYTDPPAGSSIKINSEVLVFTRKIPEYSQPESKSDSSVNETASKKASSKAASKPKKVASDPASYND